MTMWGRQNKSADAGKEQRCWPMLRRLGWIGLGVSCLFTGGAQATECLYKCVSAPQVVLPSGETSGQDATGLEGPCPAGQVPQPTDRSAPKGRPWPSVSHKSSPVYYYVAAWQHAYTAGLTARVSIHDPYLWKYDYHTLAELAAGSADGRNLVEAGWTVDPSVNGDWEPHVFVFSWVEGTPKCYNGCGWVQVSGTHYPGMKLDPELYEEDSPRITILNYYGSWWVAFDDVWMGYFPGSAWDSTFYTMETAQWFGEVAAAYPRTCTDMGSGASGSSDYAASFSNMAVVDYYGTTTNAAAASYVSRERFYSIGDFTGSSFSFGGEGGW